MERRKMYCIVRVGFSRSWDINDLSKGGDLISVYLEFLSKCNTSQRFVSLQESKKCFKRADLARKEKEEYFKKCGFKVDINIFFLFYIV